MKQKGLTRGGSRDKIKWKDSFRQRELCKGGKEEGIDDRKEVAVWTAQMGEVECAKAQQ